MNCIFTRQHSFKISFLFKRVCLFLFLCHSKIYFTLKYPLHIFDRWEVTISARLQQGSNMDTIFLWDIGMYQTPSHVQKILSIFTLWSFQNTYDSDFLLYYCVELLLFWTQLTFSCLFKKNNFIESFQAFRNFNDSFASLYNHAFFELHSYTKLMSVSIFIIFSDCPPT